ncbi:MAG: hypothetical protein ACKVT2_13145 [Saprospiraceae bacterium]
MQSVKIFFTFLFFAQLGISAAFAQDTKPDGDSPNLATVKVIYELFGKGDIPSLLCKPVYFRELFNVEPSK